MFKLSKFSLFVITLVTASTVLFVQARKEARLLQRKPIALMNRYYLLRQSNPEKAQNALLILLKKDDTYIPALKEMSFLYLQKNNPRAALPLMQQLHALLPKDNDTTYQLATMYYEMGEWGKAQVVLNELKTASSWDVKIKAQNLLYQMASYIPYFQNNATVISTMTIPQSPNQINTILLNFFYKLKQEEHSKAQQMLLLLSVLNSDNPLVFFRVGLFCFATATRKRCNFIFSTGLQLKS